MAEFEQKRYASMVRLLQTAYPQRSELHLGNLGLTTSTELPPADLDQIMKHVSWLVCQTGIKDPDRWIATDMARVAAASVSGEPEVSVKGPLPEAVRQKRAELKPVRFEVDIAKAPSVSSPASDSGSKETAIGIGTRDVLSPAPFASVETVAPLKDVLPVAARRNSVEAPIDLGVDHAETSGASPMASETAIAIDRLLRQAKLAIKANKPREAAVAIFNANEKYGATQQQIAAAVGRCQAWVSWMLRWRREGFHDTPFGEASKVGRLRARIGRLGGEKLPRRGLPWHRRGWRAPPNRLTNSP
jgi:hypothetical protein